MLTLHTPYVLALLVFLPWLLVSRQGTPLFRLSKSKGVFFSLSALPKNLSSSRKLYERMLVTNTLRVVCFISLVIALARPQTETSYSEVEASGRDIFIAMDTSGSMNALDFRIDGKRVDRLTALKKVVNDFIDARKGDRLGLVVFGTEVFTQCPLTLDHGVLKDLVSSLEVGMAGDGTALGDGLVVAVKRLKDIPAESRVIVLVTDGVKTAGSLEPEVAAEIAKKEGIKVYTIGIGGNKPAPFKVMGMFGIPQMEYRPVELDEKTLREMAESTGGKYFNAEKTEALEEIYQQISKLEERVEKTFEYHDYEEHYFFFLILGLLTFLIHELAAATRYLIVP